MRRQVGELRDRTLKWTPRGLPLRQLTFAGNFLYTALRSEVVALDCSGKTEVRRFSVQGHHQLVTLADGSLLGVGANSTFVIHSGGKQPENQRSVLLLPQEVLFGNAGVNGLFDAFDAAVGRWSSYSFNSKPGISSVWLPDTAYEQPELKQGVCAQLLDGSYACYARDSLWQLHTKSRARPLGKCPPGAHVWRVLPAARADQAWVARNDATLERWWLVQPPKRLSVSELPWTPLDVAVRGEHVAVIRIAQSRAQPKQLSLVVLDVNGRTRFEQPLPSSTGEVNTTEADILEAEVVVHPRQPWIGVRTSRGTRVVDLESGSTLMLVE